jgi:hypothetical protein
MAIIDELDSINWRGFKRVKVLTVTLTYFMILYGLVLRSLCQWPLYILSRVGYVDHEGTEWLEESASKYLQWFQKYEYKKK